MAKTVGQKRPRGRPRKPPGEAKTAGFSTRLDQGLRGDLQRAADRSGRSLSHEIQQRLRRSFDHERNIQDLLQAFGGPETYALLRMAAQMIKSLEQWGDKRWFDDPWLHRGVTNAIAILLDQVKPPGKAKPPKALRSAPIPPDTIAAASVLGVIDSVALAEDQPLSDLFGAPLAEFLTMGPMLKRGLGTLFDRLRILEVNEKGAKWWKR